MIYADSTELRGDTRLPTENIRELPNLEGWTGADILISPYDDRPLKPLPSKGNKLIPPVEIALRKNVRHGILVQRKSGGDLIGSINDLSLIESRMLSWGDGPWLLVTGVRKRGGRVQALEGSGRWRARTKWSWSSISGALDSWQDRGGCVKMLETDDEIPEWLKQRENKCKEWISEPVKRAMKVKRQTLAKSKENWYTTLGAWPKGIGHSMLSELAKHLAKLGLPPTLANAISVATSEEVLNVKGWGDKRLADVRTWYGVEETLSIGDGYSIVGGKLYVVGDVRLGELTNPVQLENEDRVLERIDR